MKPVRFVHRTLQRDIPIATKRADSIDLHQELYRSVCGNGKRSQNRTPPYLKIRLMNRKEIISKRHHYDKGRPAGGLKVIIRTRTALRAAFLFARLFTRPNPDKLSSLCGPCDPRSDQDHSERCAQGARRDAIDAAGDDRRNFVHRAALPANCVLIRWTAFAQSQSTNAWPR